MGPYLETIIGGLMSGMLYSLVALGFVLIFKASGVFNFAQGAMLKPIKFSCQDHQGADQARLQQWDGKQWKIISDFYTADESVLAPMVKETAAKYAKEKNITPRDCAKES